MAASVARPPVLIGMEQTVGPSLSRVQYGVALHGMPAQLPLCTTAFLPGGGITQSTWSTALPCTIRLHPYGVPQPCNLQQVTMHPLLPSHHSTMQMPGGSMMSQPPVQPQFVPASLNLQGPREVHQYSSVPEHHQLHYYPYPVAHHLPSSVALSAAPAADFHLPTHPTARLSSSRVHGGSYGRLQRTASMHSSRWRTIPPPQQPYPPYLLHFLAMFGNPAVPSYGVNARQNVEDLDSYEALLNLAERLGDAKSRGMSKADIDQLPCHRHIVGCCQSFASEDQPVCVVCMSEFESRQLLRTLPCSHEFHAKCVDKWLRMNRTCPLCRADVAEPVTVPAEEHAASQAAASSQ